MSKSENSAEEKLTKQQLKEQQKQEKLKKQKAKKEKKEKKPGIFKKLRDAWLELKKVTWPTFATVVKKTGVVILVVLIFTVVLLGIDYLLGQLYGVFFS